MYYLVIKNEQIIDKTQMQCTNADVINIEVTKEIYDESDKYIYQNGEIILDPDYEEKQEIKRKQERIEEIKKELDSLDLKSIRSIRANETDRIAQYEAQAQALRDEMHDLIQEIE